MESKLQGLKELRENEEGREYIVALFILWYFNPRADIIQRFKFTSWTLEIENFQHE